MLALVHHEMQNAATSRAAFPRRNLSARGLQLFARGLLSLTLLLTLVAGNIVLPAAASGPLCTLACCAGRAPHAAGSCMQGSCASGAEDSHKSHHHSDEPQANDSAADVPPEFAGLTAGAHGSDLNNVPTIEAEPSSQLENPTSPHLSAAAASKPCAADCGACAPGFQAPKRSRAVALTARSQHAPRPTPAKLNGSNQFSTHTSPGFSEPCQPRGPPSPISLIS
jgi:hypothetical protein